MYYQKLEKDRNFLLRERKFSIFVLAVEAFFFAVLSLAALVKPLAAISALLPAAAAAISVYRIVQDNRLLFALSSIADGRTLNRTFEVKLDRPRITLRPRSEIRIHSSVRYIQEYRVIIVRGPKKMKYYYFLDGDILLSRNRIAEIEAKFYREISLQCYENTPIIKTVQNDPHFLSDFELRYR